MFDHDLVVFIKASFIIELQGVVLHHAHQCWRPFGLANFRSRLMPNKYEVFVEAVQVGFDVFAILGGIYFLKKRHPSFSPHASEFVDNGTLPTDTPSVMVG